MNDAVLSDVHGIERKANKLNVTPVSIKPVSLLDIKLNARIHLTLESEDSPRGKGLINLDLNISENVLRDSGMNQMVSRYTLSEPWRRLK